MILTLEERGLEEARQLLGYWNELGANIGAVELKPRTRQNLPSYLAGEKHGKKHGSNYGNDQILQSLVDTGRDFVTNSEDDLNDIAQAFIVEAERRTPELLTGGNVYTQLSKSTGVNSKTKKLARETAAAAMIEAMKKFMAAVTERINSQTSNTGGIEALSPQYATWKQNTFGFTTPIGKATGQLLDNLNPDGAGARNIRLVRSTTLATETGD